MSFAINPPFPVFTGIDGDPLDGGKIYVGVANLNPVTNPVALYWDEALTIAAVQPIVTSGGYAVRNGTPARFFAAVDTVSITVKDAVGVTVFTAASISDIITAFSVPGGSALIGFIQSGTGAVARTAQSKMRDTLNVKDYGADGSDTVDNALALVAAEEGVGTLGNKLHIPQGIYRATDHDNDDAVWRVDSPIYLQGSGFYTAIKPDGVANTVDTFVVSPSALVDNSLTVVEAFGLGNPTNGTREGRHGIFLRTDAGELLPKTIIREMAIQLSPVSGARALVLSNNPANIEGGSYCTEIRSNLFKGGVQLDAVGDSIVADSNIVTSENIGWDINLIAGATGPFIYNDNCTSLGGAAVFRRSLRSAIVNPNWELTDSGDATANDNSILNFKNDSGTGVGGYLQGGWIAGFTSAVFSNVVRIANHIGFTFLGSTLPTGASGKVGILIESDAQATRVFGQTFNANSILNPVDDRGVGTMGVLQVLAAQDGTDFSPTGKPRFQNGWVGHVSTEAPSYMKCPVTGRIDFFGDLAGGTTTGGTIIFRLATGFRPAGNTIARVVDTFDGTTWSKATVTIHGTASATPGRVTIAGASATRLCLSGLSWMAENGAHAVTYE